MASPGGQAKFCRTFPTRVAAEHATDMADFSPALRRLQDQAGPEREGAVLLLRQALGAVVARLVPAPRDGVKTPWCALTAFMTERHAGDFAWPTNVAILAWTDKPELLSHGQRADLAAASRSLLRHALGTARGADSLIAASVQGVCRTLEADTKAGVAALRSLTVQERSVDHGRRDLFWLAQERRRILAAAPELLADVFRASFLASLPARGQSRMMYDSQILPLVTDTRQDRDLVRHLLADVFESFVLAEPRLASETLAAILDSYVPAKGMAKQEGRIGFEFEGAQAGIVPDGSCWWWRQEADRRGQDYEVALLDKWVAGLRAAGKNGVANTVLANAANALAPGTQWAVAWCARLWAAVAHPVPLGLALIPFLCDSRILAVPDVIHAAGDLIRALHPAMTVSDRLACEGAIMALPQARLRRQYLACLDPRFIALPSAKGERDLAEAGDGLPLHGPPVRFSTEVQELDPDWWLRDAGVDTEAEPNVSILALSRSIMEANAGGDAWPEITRLFGLLASANAIHERVSATAWQAIAEKVCLAAESSRSQADLDKLPGIRELVLRLVDPSNELAPNCAPDAEREQRFAQSPSWSSPSPRVEGTCALMACLGAAPWTPEGELARALHRLMRDGAPEVRMQVQANLHRLAEAGPDEMWSAFEFAFSHEGNRGVLSSTVASLSTVAHLNPGRAAGWMLALRERQATQKEGAQRDQLSEQLVGGLLRLWIAFGNEAAQRWAMDLAGDPLRSVAEVGIVAVALRDCMRQGQAHAPEPQDEATRARTVEFFARVTRSTALRWANAIGTSDRGALQDALTVLDSISINVYFGSGAYAARNPGNQPDVQPELALQTRFLREYHGVLADLAGIGHASVAHHVLETIEAFVAVDPGEVFSLVCKTIEAGKLGGYQFEQMGADLLVRIVRRYLADYRALFASDESHRQGLISCLDAFAEVGYPEARMLAFELPVLLR